jgi:hypothetical protein
LAAEPPVGRQAIDQLDADHAAAADDQNIH